MRLTDRAAGLLLVVVGLAVAIEASRFPPMPGQPVGPSLFPGIIGLVLALIGGGMAVSGVRSQERGWVLFDDWLRSPRLALRALLVVGALVLYMAIVDRLGFLPTGLVLLAVLFLAFGVRRAWILPIAAGVTLAIHYGFYTLLHVPLPWGVLERVAW